MTNALVLGGGAPNLTLMSGALLGLDERGVSFDVISTTGAGMLVGLLYAAPKNGDRRAALAATRNMGVSDSIYQAFPVNFKVFHKPGAAAEIYTRFAQHALSFLPKETESQRLFSDFAALASASFCPTDLNPMSKGLCQPAPWIEAVVDFDQLKNFDGEFYLSAYSLDRRETVVFAKDEITAEHFRAALAMPFIYSPFQINGETFIESSAMMPFNWESVLDCHPGQIDMALGFDVLGTERLIREPRSLLDAWVLSIIIPLVRLARLDAEVFLRMQERPHRQNTVPYLLQWTDLVAEEHWPHVLDWSYSNLSRLFDIGEAAAERFHIEYEAARTEELEGKQLLGKEGVGDQPADIVCSDVLPSDALPSNVPATPALSKDMPAAA